MADRLFDQDRAGRAFAVLDVVIFTVADGGKPAGVVCRGCGADGFFGGAGSVIQESRPAGVSLGGAGGGFCHERTVCRRRGFMPSGVAFKGIFPRQGSVLKNLSLALL